MQYFCYWMADIKFKKYSENLLKFTSFTSVLLATEIFASTEYCSSKQNKVTSTHFGDLMKIITKVNNTSNFKLF